MPVQYVDPAHLKSGVAMTKEEARLAFAGIIQFMDTMSYDAMPEDIFRRAAKINANGTELFLSLITPQNAGTTSQEVEPVNQTAITNWLKTPLRNASAAKIFKDIPLGSEGKTISQWFKEYQEHIDKEKPDEAEALMREFVEALAIASTNDSTSDLALLQDFLIHLTQVSSCFYPTDANMATSVACLYPALGMEDTASLTGLSPLEMTQAATKDKGKKESAFSALLQACRSRHELNLHAKSSPNEEINRKSKDNLKKEAYDAFKEKRGVRKGINKQRMARYKAECYYAPIQEELSKIIGKTENVLKIKITNNILSVIEENIKKSTLVPLSTIVEGVLDSNQTKIDNSQEKAKKEITKVKDTFAGLITGKGPSDVICPHSATDDSKSKGFISAYREKQSWTKSLVKLATTHGYPQGLTVQEAEKLPKPDIQKAENIRRGGQLREAVRRPKK